MALFIIGCIVFVICALIQTALWDVIDGFSVFFMWVCSLLILCFYSYGNLFFSDKFYKWILFSAASLILVLYVIYVIHYYIDNDFEWWIFCFVPPAVLDIVFIINTFIKMDLEWLMGLQTAVNWVFGFVIIVSVLITTVFLIYHWGSSNKEKELNRYYAEKALHESSLYNRDISKIRLIGTTQQELDIILDEIYFYLKGNEEKVNKSFYSISDDIDERIKALPENAKTLLEARLKYMEFYRIAPELGLSEFKGLLFPEYYGYYSNETQSVQQRILEDLPSKIVNLVSQNMAASGDANTNQARDLLQSQMRQLFHNLMTPIIAIENSIKLIKISREDEDYSQIVSYELSSIENSFKIVKSLLYAYRRVAMMDFSDSNTGINIATQAMMTVDSLNRQYSKNCVLRIRGNFEKMNGFASELIVALLVPLLQNAVEASPDEGQIIMSEEISSHNVIIEVTNISIENVDNQIFQSYGKTSKKNHEGLGLLSVSSIASHIHVDFSIASNGPKVTAKLTFPIRKEGAI